jgi:hypothetical protein
MTELDGLGEAAKLFAGASALALLLANVYTMARPARSSAAAAVAAMAGGVFSALLYGFASGLFLTVAAVGIVAQTVAQLLIVGLLAGGGAAGLNASTRTAEAKRLEVQGPPAEEQPALIQNASFATPRPSRHATGVSTGATSASGDRGATLPTPERTPEQIAREIRAVEAHMNRLRRELTGENI